MTQRTKIRETRNPSNRETTIEYALPNGDTEVEEYRKDGSLRCRSCYRNGKLHGTTTYLHSNGALSWTANYVDGRRVDGHYKDWHDNGQLRGVVHYVGGFPQGMHQRFDSAGRLAHVLWELDGEDCSRKRYAAACATRPELPRDGLTDAQIAAAASKPTWKKPRPVYPKLRLSTQSESRDLVSPEVALADWKSRGAIDALEWLSQPGFVFPKSFCEKSHPTSREMCEFLIELGAAALLVVPGEGQDLNREEMASTLLIWLPGDGKKRALLFGFQHEYLGKRGFDGDDDVGQPYLLLPLK